MQAVFTLHHDELFLLKLIRSTCQNLTCQAADRHTVHPTLPPRGLALACAIGGHAGAGDSGQQAVDAGQICPAPAWRVWHAAQDQDERAAGASLGSPRVQKGPAWPFRRTSISAARCGTSSWIGFVGISFDDQHGHGSDWLGTKGQLAKERKQLLGAGKAA
jgi:hypothetical protein